MQGWSERGTEGERDRRQACQKNRRVFSQKSDDDDVDEEDDDNENDDHEELGR